MEHSEENIGWKLAVKSTKDHIRSIGQANQTEHTKFLPRLRFKISEENFLFLRIELFRYMKYSYLSLHFIPLY